MNKFDSILFGRAFTDIDELLGENLTLKKKTVSDDEFIFVVASDNPDITKGNNETFVKRELIKNSGLFIFDKGNTRKWISKEKFNANDFNSNVSKYKQVINTINGLEDIIDSAEELEEYGDIGFSDRISLFIDELKNKVTSTAQSKEVLDFLNFKKRFRKYSLYNSILIFIQNKNATLVKGARKWEKELGRKIKAGEKGIYIYVPVKIGDKDGDKGEPLTVSQPQSVEDLRTTRFILRPIFDISQTEEIPGKAVKIPDEIKWYSDEEADEKTRIIYDALVELAKTKGVTVSLGDVGHERARGVSKGGSINLINTNIATLIHELAHEMLHWKDDRESFSKQVKELQAEGVAHVVLKEFGLPTGTTENYLVLWKIDAEHITKNESVIKKTSEEIIDFINDFATKDASPEVPVTVPESLNMFQNVLKKYSL